MQITRAVRQLQFPNHRVGLIMIDHRNVVDKLQFSSIIFLKTSWKFLLWQGLCVHTVGERDRHSAKQLLSSVFSFSSEAERIQVKSFNWKWLNDPVKPCKQPFPLILPTVSLLTPPGFLLKPCIHPLSLPLIGSRSEVCGVCLSSFIFHAPWGAFIPSNWFWKSRFTDHKA